MKPIAWRLLALSSLLVAILAAGETRPRYGGTLRVTMSAAPASLDPATLSGSETGRQVSRLIYETLVSTDRRGNVIPAVALRWQSEMNGQRWRFQLRPALRWHDGAPVTAESVAAALRAANSTWTIRAAADEVMVENATPIPDLLADLTLPRYALLRREPGRSLGTGAFQVRDWQPGKLLLLGANDEYWGGRPFLDALRIELGQNVRQQMIALELGKTDVVELSPEMVRRTQARHVESGPVEFMALVFARDPATQQESDLRRAFALSADRGSLHRILVQGEGEVAAGLLPEWMSGYEFLFSSPRDLDRARQLRAGIRQAPPLTISYDGSDTLAQLVAERLALNAREAGINVRSTAAGEADARLLRLRVQSPDPRVALRELTTALNWPPPLIGRGSWEELYRAELAVLEGGRVLPLLYLPQAFAISPKVRNWEEAPFGNWHLENVWIGGVQP
jgi:ABC-type transport system substrate-binding protein